MLEDWILGCQASIRMYVDGCDRVSVLTTKQYILARPHPSLRIIFVSPSMRTPGLLRTPLFSKVSGSTSTMQSLESAFEDGASVTCKVVWLPAGTSAREGQENPARQRWMRATPLLGSDDDIGIWMCVFVPVREDDNRAPRSMGSASGIEFDFAKREQQMKGQRGTSGPSQSRTSVRRCSSRSRDTRSRASHMTREESREAVMSPSGIEQQESHEGPESRRASRYAGPIPTQKPGRDSRYRTQTQERGESSRSQATSGAPQRTRQSSARYREMYLDRPEDDPAEYMEEDTEMYAPPQEVPGPNTVGLSQSLLQEQKSREVHEEVEMAGVQEERAPRSDLPPEPEHRRIRVDDATELSGGHDEVPPEEMAVETIEEDI